MRQQTVELRRDGSGIGVDAIHNLSAPQLKVVLCGVICPWLGFGLFHLPSSLHIKLPLESWNRVLECGNTVEMWPDRCAAKAEYARTNGLNT